MTTINDYVRCITVDPTVSVRAKLHAEAFALPRDGYEKSIVYALQALAHGAAAYEREFEMKLAVDAILGDAWEAQLRGLVAMLNGSCGRLDAGMIDSAARALHRLAGFGGEL